MTIEFARERQDMTREARPLTWDYAVRWTDSPVYAHDLVLATCPHGHTCRLVSTVHRVADDGTLSPSYVCPCSGCVFHDFVRLVGWDAKLSPDVVKPDAPLAVVR